MNDTTFDRFVRAADVARSRRGALGLLAGVHLAGLLAHLEAEDGTAKRKRHGRRHSHRPGKKKQNRKGKRKGGGLGGANCDVCPSGCAFATIQAAIDAATAGDTITICPVEFTENVIVGKDITLVGSGEGAAVAGAGGSSVVTVNEGVTATIHGVAIGKGVGTPIGNTRFGGGIFNEGDLTLIDLDLGENTAGGGGAIFNMGTLTLNKVIVSFNQADQGGGIMSQSTVTIGNGSTISNNQANQGGGFYNNGGTMTLSGGSDVVGNNADSDGGGIYGSGQMIIDASFVQSNTAKGNGGGVLNDRGGTLTVRNSAVIDKNSAANGGGVYNNGDPGGVQPVLTVSDSAITNNEASELGGGIFNDDGIVSLQASTVIRNKATGPDSGGGIFNTDGGSVTLDAESAVEENDPDNCIGTPACAA